MQQALALAPLFPLADVAALLWPFLLSLVDDEAACVRKETHRAVRGGEDKE